RLRRHRLPGLAPAPRAARPARARLSRPCRCGRHRSDRDGRQESSAARGPRRKGRGSMRPEADRTQDAAASGRLLSLTAVRPAAGGTFVARHEGRAVFVRGTAPGETATGRLLEDPREQADARFSRAETIGVLEAGVDRVHTVWPEAGVAGVAGAAWAPIAPPARGCIASEVMQELLQRAGVTSFPIDQVQVEPAAHDVDGLGWRTRVRFAVAADGRVG